MAGAGAAPCLCYWLDRPAEPDPSTLSPGHSDDAVLCHDCGDPHARWACRGGASTGCANSYCRPCAADFGGHLADPRGPSHSMFPAFCAGSCPCCLGVCARRACVAAGSSALPASAPATAAQRTLLALHTAWCLLEHVAALLREACVPLVRRGVGPAAVDPAFAPELGEFVCGLPSLVRAAASSSSPRRLPSLRGSCRPLCIPSSTYAGRLLCDRCAACLEAVHLRCPGCNVDLCYKCLCACASERGAWRWAARALLLPLRPFNSISGPLATTLCLRFAQASARRPSSRFHARFHARPGRPCSQSGMSAQRAARRS